MADIHTIEFNHLLLDHAHLTQIIYEVLAKMQQNNITQKSKENKDDERFDVDGDDIPLSPTSPHYSQLSTD